MVDFGTSETDSASLHVFRVRAPEAVPQPLSVPGAASRLSLCAAAHACSCSCCHLRAAVPVDSSSSCPVAAPAGSSAHVFGQLSHEVLLPKTSALSPVRTRITTSALRTKADATQLSAEWEEGRSSLSAGRAASTTASSSTRSSTLWPSRARQERPIIDL